MSDLADDAGPGWPKTDKYSAAFARHAAHERARLDRRPDEPSPMLAAALALIAETDWTPPPRKLLCGCWTDGRMCEWHAPRAIAAE
jgi:hypothetical protein